MAKMIQKVRIVAISISVISIVASIFHCILFICYEQQYRYSFDWTYVLANNIVSVLTSITLELIPILLALLIDPNKVAALFNKRAGKLEENKTAGKDETDTGPV